MASRRFNAQEDFLSLGKKLQAQTEELDTAADLKAKHTALLLDTRRALDIARTQLHDIKQRHQVVSAEASAFESRAEKVAKEVLVRGHEEKNLQKEVHALKQELYLTTLEAKELSIGLEYEHITKDHISGLVATAQQELHAQIQERDRLRKEEHEMAKIAACQRGRLSAFTSMNARLLQDIS